MGRHVVRPFDGVAVQRRIFFDQSLEKRFQVPLHIGIGVFLDGQRGTGMLAENRQLAGGDALAGNPAGNFTGDFIKPLSAGFDAERFLGLFHGHCRSSGCRSRQ